MNTMVLKKKLGKELVVGDVLDVWWRKGGDQITNINPYVGKYSETARVAEFAVNQTGMTIFNDDVYRVWINVSWERTGEVLDRESDYEYTEILEGLGDDGKEYEATGLITYGIGLTEVRDIEEQQNVEV